MNNSIKLTIWGREFDISVLFDCYSGEEKLPEQTAAYDAFIKNASKILESAKSNVESYCLATDKEKINSEKIDNIFKYVIPKNIYVPRDQNGKQVIALLCNYKFNPDDGIAIVFENGNFADIGTGNII